MRASRPEIVAPSRHETWRALGVLFLAALLSGEALAADPPAAKEAPAAKPVATAPAQVAPAQVAPAQVAPAQAAPAKAAPAKVAPAKPVAAAVPKAAVVKPARAGGNTVVAVKPSAVTPARPAAKGAGVANAPSIEQQVAYQYNALGRRDPFQPMAGGGFVGDDVGGDAPPDVGGIKVVGIVWGASDKFALVEDARGTSRVLRAGDSVMNGVVETLKRDAVIVKMTVDGQTETVAIPLTRKGDQTNANR